jgi:ketosteroid isomerase-like protein
MIDERADVLDTARQWAEALVSNVAEAIGSFMSDDWVIVGPDGVIKKDDFLPHVTNGDLTHDAMDLASEPRIEIYGDTAVLTARVTNSGHFKGKPFAADEWTTDVFRRENGKWVCVLSHITPAVDRSRGPTT